MVLVWESLGRFGEVWEGLGKDLKPLGASWAVLGPLFCMLVFGMVFESALGGIWARFLRDFKGFGTDFGKVLEGLGRDFRTFWVTGLL